MRYSAPWTIACVLVFTSSAPARAVPLPECDGYQPTELPSECQTPRPGVLGSYYFGVEGYVSSLKSDVASREGAGVGGGMAARLGLALWDQLVLGFGIGATRLTDNRPYTDLVMECQTQGGSVTNCSAPHETESIISGWYLEYELGYQRRFRPSPRISLAPGMSVNVLQYAGAFTRETVCEDCPAGQKLDIEPLAVGLTPSLRMTMGRLGQYALALRSRWFVSGDLLQQTSLSFELGRP